MVSWEVFAMGEDEIVNNPFQLHLIGRGGGGDVARRRFGRPWDGGGDRGVQRDILGAGEVVN